MTFASNLSSPTRLRRASVLALVLIVSAALAILLNTFVRPPASRNDMPGGTYRSEGIFNPRPTAYGLLDPHTAPAGSTYANSIIASRLV